MHISESYRNNSLHHRSSYGMGDSGWRSMPKLSPAVPWTPTTISNGSRMPCFLYVFAINKPFSPEQAFFSPISELCYKPRTVLLKIKINK